MVVDPGYFWEHHSDMELEKGVHKKGLLIRKNSLAFGIFFAILAVSGILNTGKILKEYKTAARSYENNDLSEF